MDNSDSRLTVKQLESKKKQLKTKLSNLLDAPKRDDVVTLEELGADSSWSMKHTISRTS